MGILNWLGLRRSSIWEPYTIIDRFLYSPLTYFAIHFYYLITYLRGPPFYPPRDKPTLRVVCISDTHNQTVTIPHGDILIHAGNHDYWFDPSSRPAEDVRSGAAPDTTGLIYLERRMVTIDIKGRQVSIFGAPDMPKVGDSKFAFQYTEETQPWLGNVPVDTDILVTHCPPEAYESLLSRPHRGLIWDLVPNLAWVGILNMIYYGIRSVLRVWFRLNTRITEGSIMVNAAQVQGNTGKVINRAVIVDI
ncbi:hypothetical protein G7Z17_g4169 [Cylindrodendrum hubeiense]|uniref:Calcineurin-like phosphoesterase domain-containing protein n=1 Tax=Cylindrodendrum hubeiense TaxID=595255 RepID=A0A9P5HEF6_9HYPO|nr:hypothetical protein G7Z17_g4169 [Cylindrodendrum hubeiense]